MCVCVCVCVCVWFWGGREGAKEKDRSSQKFPRYMTEKNIFLSFF